MHALTFQIVYRSISRFVSKFSSFGMIPRVSPILEKVPELLFDLPPIYVYDIQYIIKDLQLLPFL